jgi:hypothetical protein
MDHLLGDRVDLVAAAASEHRFHRRLKLFRDSGPYLVMANADLFQNILHFKATTFSNWVRK